MLPEQNFHMDFNDYGYQPNNGGYDSMGMGNPETRRLFDEVQREYYRVMFEHGRGYPNIIPYYTNNMVKVDYAPVIEMNGSELVSIDWTGFDKMFGQFLDGSYTEDIVGRKIPVPAMVLPFSEGWPMNMLDYHFYDVDYWRFADGLQDSTFATEYNVISPSNPSRSSSKVDQMRMMSNGPRADLGEEYRDGIKNVLKAFAEHIDAMGWTETAFQIYFNNKHYDNFPDGVNFLTGDDFLRWCGLWNFTENKSMLSDRDKIRLSRNHAWWLLDEPYKRPDWAGVEYYYEIIRETEAEVLADGKAFPIDFRIDASREYNMHDFLRGMDYNVCNLLFSNNNTVIGRGGQKVLQQRKIEWGEEWWNYGTWSALNNTSINNAKAILDTYVKGGNGFLSYQNTVSDNYYNYNDSFLNLGSNGTAMIVSGKNIGIDSALASTHMKAVNASTELTRYLDALQLEYGYTQQQIREYACSFVNVDGVVTVEFEDDAGVVTYNPDNNLEALKRDALKKLEATLAPQVSVTGPELVVSGPDATATYTISVRNMPKVSGIELEFEIDGDFLGAKAFNGVGFDIIGDGNYGSPIYWRNAGNKWIGKATLVNAEGASGHADILNMVFGVKEGVLGVSDVKLTYVLMSYGGDAVPAEIKDGVAATVFAQYYVRYDLNKDGVVDLNDITFALQFFGARAGDADWNAAKAADLDGDGVVDVSDLLLILANYTVPYYK